MATKMKFILPRIFRRLYSVCSGGNILSLRDRGLLQEIFPSACPKFSEVVSNKSAAYAGFDPTADSLHVGNLLVVMAMLHCQRAKQQIIAVLGGATTRLGDPSGVEYDRPILDLSVIWTNTKSIEKSLRRIFENHEKLYSKQNPKQKLTPVKFVNNLEFYKKFQCVDFFMDIGQDFRIETMIKKRNIQSRLLAEGLSYNEFLYQVFQAYDWWQLFRSENCVLQIGGDDQKSNIEAGQEFINRIENKTVYGALVPLITSESGDKFGKRIVGDTVWLNPEKTSHFDFYQFFIRVEDSQVEKYLKLYTLLSLTEIEDIMKKNKTHPEPRYAQSVLASHVTELVHGEEGLDSALRVTNAFYSKKPEALLTLSETELRQVFQQTPTTELPLLSDMTLLEVAMKAGCFHNEVDARRIIAAGGFYVNHRRVRDADYNVVPDEHVLPNNLSLLRCGKKNYYVVKWL